MSHRTARTVVSVLAIVVAVGNPLVAQQRIPGWDRVAGPGEHAYNVQLLRPTGGPVVPIFDGWYVNPDGTRELCFGYFNVNTEEVLEIPLGPDNFIEPSEFHGEQPTHFLPVGSTSDNGRRAWCVFTVQVPEDYGDRDVVWTLRIDGREFSVPGRTRYTAYQLQGERAPDLRTLSPLLKLDPAGPSIVGPDGDGIIHGPLSTSVGMPLLLSAWARRDNPFGLPIIAGSSPLGEGEDSRPIGFTWFKHQGPGDVIFSQREVRIEPDSWTGAPDDLGSATVEATFSRPGRYILRVLTHNVRTSYTHFCCWTNGFLSIDVSP